MNENDIAETNKYIIEQYQLFKLKKKIEKENMIDFFPKEKNK
jgi:hypothetical protein